MNLPIELKTRIYDHIGTVQKHLAELPADEQREILQALETHIHDALEARSNGNPDLEMLEAIIAEMDPPESYGSAPLMASPNSTSFSPGRKIIFFASVGILCLLFIAIWLADPFSSHWMDESAPAEAADPTEVIPEEAVLKDSAVTNAPRQSPLVGKWTAIDFVSSISEFSPKRMYNVGGLELKGLEFLPDGKTDKPWWSWKDNQLSHSGDQSVAELMIVTVNQTKYLFMEWMSGDVLTHKDKPKYYVLKRGAYIDPAKVKTIIEGVGWNAFSIDATRTELIAEFGPPDNGKSSVMAWRDKHIMCHVYGGVNSALHKAVQLNFLSEFSGITSKGIQIGSTEVEVLAAYGNPNRISKSIPRTFRAGSASNNTIMTWLELGIQLILNESSGVTQIDIIAPQVP